MYQQAAEFNRMRFVSLFLTSQIAVFWIYLYFFVCGFHNACGFLARLCSIQWICKWAKKAVPTALLYAAEQTGHPDPLSPLPVTQWPRCVVTGGSVAPTKPTIEVAEQGMNPRHWTTWSSRSLKHQSSYLRQERKRPSGA